MWEYSGKLQFQTINTQPLFIKILYFLKTLVPLILIIKILISGNLFVVKYFHCDEWSAQLHNPDRRNIKLQ